MSRFIVVAATIPLSVVAGIIRLTVIFISAYYIGETLTPALKPGDLFVALSGSGKTTSTVALARRAKEVGAELLQIAENFPLHEFRQKYCKNCPDIEFCKVNFENHLLCLIAKLTLEITGQNNLTIKLNSHKF